MKKTLLLMMLCLPMLLAAQDNGVTVSNLAIDAGTVTFNVSWKNTNMPKVWSDTVWVFVDYNNKGVMERLPLLPGATLTTTFPGGKVIEEPDNNQGVWVAGNARTNSSFSATVKLLTAVKDVGGACVYGSNYPPVGEYISPETVKFTGTPPYDLTLNTGTDQAYGNYNLLSGQTLDSFTDKTGAPGIIIPGYNQPQGGCTYTEPAVVGTFASFNPSNVGSSTYVSLTDERDNKNYPVLKMGDRWIMARNLNYQKGLTWQANSGLPSTANPSCTYCIGSFWCPGTITASTKVACEVYGALYTWETAMLLDGYGIWTEVATYSTGAATATAAKFNQGRPAHSGNTTGGRGICPPNWHVPTDYEWGVFFDKVEGSGSAHLNAEVNVWAGTYAGQRSKAACVGAATDAAPLWANYDNRGIDSYGFRVLPTGFRGYNGSSFLIRGFGAVFWSSSANSGSYAWDQQFSYARANVYHETNPRSYGFSVRCIRDEN